jgi:ribose-phosphate pyrophosphokinase
VAGSALETLITTDTIVATEAMRVSENIRRLTTAPLMAEAMRRISDESSVSSLWD